MKAIDQAASPEHAGTVAGTVGALLAEVRPAGAPARPAGTLGEWGLASLEITRLWIGLQRELGADLPPAWLAQATEEQLIRRVTALATAGPAPGPLPGHAPGSEAGPAGDDPYGDDPYGPFPVTDLQQAYLVAKQPGAAGDPAGCHVYREFTVPGLDPERLRRAWQDVIDRHDMLRVIVGEDGFQSVRPDGTRWELPVHDLTGYDQDAARARREEVRRRLSRHLYQPGDWPLFAIEVSRLPGGTDVVHLSLDTLITDGHGYALLLRHWHDRYQHPEVPLPSAALTPRACVLALAAVRGGPASEASLRYWRDELADQPAGPGLVLDPPAAPPGPPPTAARPRRPLDDQVSAAQWAAVKDAAGRARVSPTALVLDHFCEALERAGARRPFALVVTTSLRPYLPRSADEVVGPFTSTAIHVVDGGGTGSPGDAVRAVHERLGENLRHGLVSGIGALRARPGARAVPPPAIVFTSLLDVGPRPGVAGGFGASVVYGTSQTTGVALDHQMWEQDEALHLRWDVDDARFAAGVIDVAWAAFRNALAATASEAAPGDPALTGRAASGADGGPAGLSDAGLSDADPSDAGPLRELQESYLVARAGAGDPDGCQCYRTFDVPGLDVARLAAALSRLADGVAVLRAQPGPDGLRVRRVGLTPWLVPVIDLTGAAPDEVARTLGRLRDEMTLRPFPLGRWPLIDVRVTREPAGRTTVHCSYDLLVADGKSIHGLFRELWRLYADDDAVPAPGTAGPAGHPAGPAAPGSRYWERRLRDIPPGPALPAPRHDGPARTRQAGEITGYRQLARRAAEHGLTVDDLLLTAFTKALSRSWAQPFALPVVLWPDGDEPARPAERSFLTWLAAAPAAEPTLVTARAYRRQLIADLSEGGPGALAALRRVTRGQRSGSLPYPVVYTGLVDLTSRPLPPGVREGHWLTCTPGCALDCVAIAEGDRLQYAWDIADGLLAPGAVAELFAAFDDEVRGCTDDAWWTSAAAVGAAALAPAAQGRERDSVVYRWNQTTTAVPDDGPTHLLFERHARRAPDAVALRWRGGTMTYGELNRRANQVAWRLRDLGAGAGSVTGICVRRGPEMVAAVHGVLKAGGAYLPIDPAQPAARVNRLLSLAGCGTVLTTSDTPLPELASSTRVILLDRDPGMLDPGRAGDDPPVASTLDDTAYVIFTSGSTGTPKGVAVAHRSVRNLISFCARTFGLTSHDVGLAVTSLCFDLSVFDVLGLLGSGAGIYLADEEQQRDPDLLLDVLLGEPVTLWNSAPTALHQLTPLLSPGRGNPAAGNLRLILLSGDFIPLSLPGRMREAFPSAGTIALGGPTETTVWSNVYRVGEVDPAWRSIPYGRPIDNTRHYVLDAALRPCPIGTEGDLYTAGTCLALGFIGRPELTAHLFVPDPYAADPTARMYRTGDRALWADDGNLRIVGRADTQMKIRGHRVEAGEIEHRLRAHATVADAVVLARRDPAGDTRLVAYAVPAPGATLDPAELRRHAAEALPEYMVPNAFVPVAGFPATANGKLDRDALPWPAGTPSMPSPSVTSPSPAAPPAPAVPAPAGQPDGGELTVEIAALFAQSLAVPSIDPAADLWDQGATSFTMVQVSAGLKKRLGQRIPVAALTSEPTVAGIARVVAAQLGLPATAASGPGQADHRPARPAVAAEAGTPTGAAPGAVAPSGTGQDGPGQVDMFSPEERATFKAAKWNLRRAAPGERSLPLPDMDFGPGPYAWRASRRDYLPAPVPFAGMARLLALLRQAQIDGLPRHLYPSAGDTYAVQAYLHVREGGVEGLPAGIYYYHPREHALHLINAAPRIDRTVHFYYNRPVFDGSAFGLYLIGQARGIEPVYQQESQRFLALEAGAMGQLLMTGQAAAGIGLCPVGTLGFAAIRDQFALDEGHVLLHSFMGGAAGHDPAAGVPFFTAPPAAPGITPVRGDAAIPAATARQAATGMPGRGSGDEAAGWVAGAGAGGPVVPTAGEVAVIGADGCFPGAGDLDAFWRQLRAGSCAVGPVPAERAHVTAGGPRALAGGFLPGVDRFDSLPFRIAPAEAAALDPQTRLMLESVWRCLEDGGYTPAGLRAVAPRVGVFAATMWHDHQLAGRDNWAAGGTARAAALAADVPNRISHAFGFDGPSLAVDTSCSSSLSALHLATESLRRGECDAAVVAAANLILHPYHLALLSESGLLASDGPVLAFSADGSGWCPGEGVAAVLLRPAGVATADGDDVRAIIEATRVGHRGGQGRFGTPDSATMASSIAATLAAARVSPGDVSYIECAAAGSAVADAAEIEALAAVFAGLPPIAIGTVKPNIGHLEAASGLSQLIKVLLQMRHATIAPTLAAPRRTPLVDWDAVPFRVPGAPADWPAGPAARRALVNAVGATGSYAHVLLRSAPDGPRHPDGLDAGRQTGDAVHQAVIVSATSADGLRAAAARLRDHLAERVTAGHPPRLADVAFTLQSGRVAGAHRLAVRCLDLPGLLTGLDMFVAGQDRPAVMSAIVSRPAAGATTTPPPDPAAAPDAAALAAAWLAGHDVDWSPQWPPRRRRVHLPPRAFDGPEYRLAAPAPAPAVGPAAAVLAGTARAGFAPAGAGTGDAAADSLPAPGEARAAEAYLLALYSEVSGFPADELDAATPLELFGLSSSLIVLLNARLARDFATPVSRTLFFEHADLRSAAATLTGRPDAPWRARPTEVGPPARPAAPSPPSGLAASAPSRSPAIARAAESRQPGPSGRLRAVGHRAAGDDEAIAITGIAGRYPQAPDLATFWRQLACGYDAITPLPDQRRRPGWPADIMWGAFLDGVDRFDPLFFGISPREAMLMDPQERLFLEVAWETLEDAGYSRARLRDRHQDGRVGVYVGTMYNEYPFFGVEQSLAGISSDCGSAVAGIANRVSYFLGLHGPSMTVDTMCSASLTALHLAVQSLRAGESAAALVGGVNLCLHPHKFRQLNRLRMTSTDHRCRSFGAGGDGFVPGEGVGAIMIKPLGAAIADGDRVHAVIRATSINHGGKTNGYTVPSPAAQGELVAAALRRAGIGPDAVSYVEAHGTGTALGDPVELAGLQRAFADRGPAPCAIGSVKSNIGHLEGAAGIAGLTKVVLQLRHRQLAPSLHATELNPEVDWPSSPFAVQRRLADWTVPAEAARIAGISAFGAGGANAHVIVAEYEPATAPAAPVAPAGPQLIVLSARDENRLAEVAARLADFAAAPGAPPLAQIARTLQDGREPLRERAALVARDLGELRAGLRRFLDGGDGHIIRGSLPGDVHLGARPAPESAYAPADLTALARHWAAGGQVEWARLHDPVPPMAGLPAYPFARERYWLPAAPGQPLASPGSAGPGPAARGPVLSGSAALEPAAPEPAATAAAGHWPAPPGAPARGGRDVLLLAKAWEVATAGGGVASTAGPVVTLYATGSQALAEAIAQALGPGQVRLVHEDRIPRPGPDGPSGAGPREAADQLLGPEPTVVGWIDVCDFGRDGDDPDGSWLARAALLQRLIARQPGASLRVLHVTRGLQPLPGPAPSLAGARMAGLLRPLAAEYPRLNVTVLDTDAAPDVAAGQVRAEWPVREPVTEACYRAGQRYLPRLVPAGRSAGPAAADAATGESGRARFQADPARTYVVSGGTRGIGAQVARWLVRHGARRLALLSARARPPRDEGNGAVLDPADVQAMATVRDLEDAGARVLRYGAAPLRADAAASFLARVRAELGPVAGVVHCAGRPSLGRPPFVRKTAAELGAAFEPKAEGMTALIAACAPDEPDFVALMSSVSAVVPRLGAGVSDYAAANAYLDFFAAQAHGATRTRYVSVNWPTWRGTGMGVGQEAACAPAGLDAIDVAEGLRVLGDVLALPAAGPHVVPCAPLPGFDPGTLLHARPESAAGPEGTAGPQDTVPAPDGPPSWLRNIFAAALAIPAGALDPTALFGDLGVESVMLGELVQRIEERTGRSLEPAALLDHPTLNRLARYLRAHAPGAVDDAPDGHQPPGADPAATADAVLPADALVPGLTAESPGPDGAQVSRTAGAAGAPEPGENADEGLVAIIGLDCRFPGSTGPAAFWDLLAAGRCAVTEVPVARWDHRALYRPRAAPGYSISRWGGFLDGIEDFDPDFFGMTDEEAACADPAVRLVLEGTANCLSDAGYTAAEVRGRDIGVFVGTRLSHYGDRIGIRGGAAGLGGDQNFVAARVAHHFDLHGPNLVVDSACSSALVAVQLACRSLLAGESDLAFAAGVDILLDERPYLEFSAGRALSPSGRCATFDRSADGFVPGEGCGVVLLKSLRSALADGDRVLAVINAVAVNNDGLTMGLTTPNPVAQAGVVRRALMTSGVPARQIGLIEAHGTGTMIGDPIELRALTDVFGESTGETGFCAIGSVKSNLGHLFSAAGMAGLIKVVLSLQHAQLPATLFCETPNPRFDFSASPFYPNTTLRDWPSPGNQPRRAGVSAFGLGGTNAHLIASEWDARLPGWRPPARRPLPPPALRRRRCWLDRPGSAPRHPAPVLELDFRPWTGGPATVLDAEEMTSR